MELYVILLGVIISASAFMLLLKKPEYQFEKTTSGKIIKFLDYTESKRIKRIKASGILLLIVGLMVIGLGIYIMLIKK
jgi:hypothetical protein